MYNIALFFPYEYANETSSVVLCTFKVNKYAVAIIQVFEKDVKFMKCSVKMAFNID